MPNGYLQIPDWFSFENQGGGIAVANLSGGGNQDFLVTAIDNPEGKNRGMYRVGRNVDAQGQVTGGWTPWLDIPDWFSFENAGAGAAVADVDGDGQQDLIAFMIDSPPIPPLGSKPNFPVRGKFNLQRNGSRIFGDVTPAASSYETALERLFSAVWARVALYCSSLPLSCPMPIKRPPFTAIRH